MSKENALFLQVKDAITFDALWQQVADAIATLSGDIWTDTDDHDPGMTLLQAVTWNCSDLSYRTSLSLNDLLTREAEDSLFPAEFGPQNVLTCNTITAEDYRRALRDLHSSDIPLAAEQADFLLRDACLSREPEASRFNWWYDPEKRHYTFTQPEETTGAKQIVFRGNNWLSVLPSRFTQALSAVDRAEVDQYLANFLTSHRNLGEAFSRVTWLQPVTFSPQLTIGLSSDVSDLNRVVAEIYQTTEALLLPAGTRQTTEEMRNAGFSSEEIFTGPYLQHGWQPDQAPLISADGITLNLSQLFNRLLAIAGVENISGFTAGTLPAQMKAVAGDAWSWQVDSGYYPRLWGDDPLTVLASADSPLILIAKGGIYQRPSRDGMAACLSSEALIQTQPVVMPAGKLRDLSAYTPVATRLPECYQLQSPDEVIDNGVRKLHQFLLTADQQLADGGAELTALPQLLAFSGREQNNIIRGTLWPYATGSISQQVHQLYADGLTAFQQQDAAIFATDGTLNSLNFSRELDFVQYLLGYFGTSRADRPLTLDLADFLATQRAYLAQQPSLGYDRINIRIDQVSALQKRIAARIGLNSECFADNPDLGKLPFYLVEHRQLLPLMPDNTFSTAQTPDNFTVAETKVTVTQKASAGKLVRGQLIELVATEGDSALSVGPLLIVETSGDTFTLSTDNSQQLQNDLTRLQTAWQSKKLQWRNSNVWLQDMDYRLNYADTQPDNSSQCLLASNDQSPYPTMVSVGDKIIIRPAGLQLNMPDGVTNRNNITTPDDWQLEATIVSLDTVTGTIMVEKTGSDQPDFPAAGEEWRYQWNFSVADYATADRFSFVVSIVHNRSLIESGDIDAAQLIQWLQQTIMAEFPAHVSLINHWLSDSQFRNFAATYKRWQNNGSPLGDDAFAIMQMLTLGHLPVAQLGVGLMRVATDAQRTEVVGSDGSEWHTDVILSEELFYVPQDI